MQFGEVSKVRKVFSGSELNPTSASSLVALEETSFSFGEGEFVALLGPSGCGKTTLLRIVAGLVPSSSGHVTIQGKRVFGPCGDYGFVFQSPGLMPWRSVLDNVLFPMEVLRRRDRIAEDRARDLLDLVGLKQFEKARPHQLSGGMQQRVSLCRALIHEPKLLLMDEPFGALDELTRLDMNDLLLDVKNKTGAAVLFVTHSISEAIYLSDNVLIFSGRPGRIVDEIRPQLGMYRSRKIRFEKSFLEAERAAGEALGVVHASNERTKDPLRGSP